MSSSATRRGDLFQLTAIVDRMIYGGSDTFSAEDARELLRMLPPPSPLRLLLRSPITMKVNGSMPGGSVTGHAAGVGDVSVGRGDRTLGYDSRSGATIRAGQWKLRHTARFRDAMRGKVFIEIEQAVAGRRVEGTTATLSFLRGEPLALNQYRQREVMFGPFAVGAAVRVPWKVPVEGAGHGDPYDVPSPSAREGAPLLAA